MSIQGVLARGIKYEAFVNPFAVRTRHEIRPMNETIRAAELERRLSLEIEGRAVLDAMLERTQEDLSSARTDAESAYRLLDARADERSRGLRETNESLATEIARRRRIEQELRNALERAEASTKAKDQFLANVSHEIRTPMNGVIGMTQLLLHTELNDKQRTYAETAIRSSRALLTVIDDVLDISRIEAGCLEIGTRAFDPIEVMTDVESMLHATASDKGIKLRVATPPEPVRLIGDPDRSRQILINLVTNAIKFTEEGQVNVDLSISSNDASSARVQFVIADSGIGIAEEDVPTVFDAFVQVDSSMTLKYGGIGLGLAITRRLVELMDGTIDAQSTPGEGSTFTVWLTLDYAPPEEGETL